MKDKKSWNLWWIWLTSVLILFSNIACLKVLRSILEVISR